jgi:hypothetical protein
MTSCEENAEGSWIPSLSMSILILLWWISRGQSARAVRIRRWYNTKVRRNTFCTIEFVFFASYCIDPEDRWAFTSPWFDLNTNRLTFFSSNHIILLLLHCTRILFCYGGMDMFRNRTIFSSYSHDLLYLILFYNYHFCIILSSTSLFAESAMEKETWPSRWKYLSGWSRGGWCQSKPQTSRLKKGGKGISLYRNIDCLDVPDYTLTKIISIQTC